MSLPQSEDQLRQLAVDEVGMRLLRAAEIIRQRGWCQRAIEHEGRHCVLGAILKADPPSSPRAAMTRFEKHMGIASLVTWNNAPERTADEVISALTQAAFRTGE